MNRLGCSVCAVRTRPQIAAAAGSGTGWSSTEIAPRVMKTSRVSFSVGWVRHCCSVFSTWLVRVWTMVGTGWSLVAPLIAMTTVVGVGASAAASAARSG